MSVRHSAPALVTYATALLTRAGLDADKAAVVAEILTEGDLLGHTTRGSPVFVIAPFSSSAR